MNGQVQTWNAHGLVRSLHTASKGSLTKGRPILRQVSGKGSLQEWEMELSLQRHEVEPQERQDLWQSAAALVGEAKR